MICVLLEGMTFPEPRVISSTCAHAVQMKKQIMTAMIVHSMMWAFLDRSARWSLSIASRNASALSSADQFFCCVASCDSCCFISICSYFPFSLWDYVYFFLLLQWFFSID